MCGFLVAYVFCYGWLLLEEEVVVVHSQNKHDTYFQYLALSLHIKYKHHLHIIA
jgi:hypothetical protein